jgi:DNA invertase Pin-like site-specific DNA recombinase
MVRKMMHARITAEHLVRSAIVHVRQSTMSQVLGNPESRHRQYQMAETARDMGFVAIEVIDEDTLGDPGPLRLRPDGPTEVPAHDQGKSVPDQGAVFCIAAPRLVRNGRDWHHLIDLCARTGVLVVDPEGVCDPRLTPRLMNDRLLPGLKRTELLPVSWTRR